MIPSFSALELQQIPNAFDDPDWVFAIKFDGVRARAQIEDSECTLISRKNNVFKRFDGLRRALPGDLKDVRGAVLDGEIVVLDAEGRSRSRSGACTATSWPRRASDSRHTICARRSQATQPRLLMRRRLGH